MAGEQLQPAEILDTLVNERPAASLIPSRLCELTLESAPAANPRTAKPIPLRHGQELNQHL
jgi:hypothetical protein